MIDIMHEASGAGSRPHSLRGLEIPTPDWTPCGAKGYGAQPMPGTRWP